MLSGAASTLVWVLDEANVQTLHDSASTLSTKVSDINAATSHAADTLTHLIRQLDAKIRELRNLGDYF